MNCSRHHKTYRKNTGERLALRNQWSNRQRYFIYWWSDKYSSNMRPCSKCLVSGTDTHFCRSGLKTWMCLRINWSACLKCRFLTQKFWVRGLRWSTGTCSFVCLLASLLILTSTLMIAVQNRERLTGAAVVRQSSMKEATEVIEYFCAWECQKSSQESVRRM